MQIGTPELQSTLTQAHTHTHTHTDLIFIFLLVIGEWSLSRIYIGGK